VVGELELSVIVITIPISNVAQLCIAIQYLENTSSGVSSFESVTCCTDAHRLGTRALVQAHPIGKWINKQKRHGQRANHIHLDPIKKQNVDRTVAHGTKRREVWADLLRGCHVPLQRRKSATAAGRERSLFFFDCSPVQVSVRRNPRDTIHSDSAYRRGCNPSRTHSETESQGGCLLFPSHYMAGLLLFYREKRSLPAYARQDTASHTLQGRQFVTCSKLASFQRLFGIRPSGVPRTLLAAVDVRPSRENPLRQTCQQDPYLSHWTLRAVAERNGGPLLAGDGQPPLSRARRAGPKVRTATKGTLCPRNPSVPGDVHCRITSTTCPSASEAAMNAGVQVLRYVAT
jgi:hypothetical protein